MFTVISMMFGGIGIGYLFRNLKFLQNVEKTTSLTIFLLLFILGLSIGSNSLIINNLGEIRMAGCRIGGIEYSGQYVSFISGVSSVFRKGGKK